MTSSDNIDIEFEFILDQFRKFFIEYGEFDINKQYMVEVYWRHRGDWNLIISEVRILIRDKKLGELLNA